MQGWGRYFLRVLKDTVTILTDITKQTVLGFRNRYTANTFPRPSQHVISTDQRYGHHEPHCRPTYFLSFSTCRFFAGSYAATGTASLESCVRDYFFSAVDSTIFYADTTANMCCFGDADTSTGTIITPSASSWTVYIKTGRG